MMRRFLQTLATATAIGGAIGLAFVVIDFVANDERHPDDVWRMILAVIAIALVAGLCIGTIAGFAAAGRPDLAILRVVGIVAGCGLSGFVVLGQLDVSRKSPMSSVAVLCSVGTMIVAALAIRYCGGPRASAADNSGETTHDRPTPDAS